KGLGISGVLLGSPKCLKRNDLQIDALLICETAIVIIDFKSYSGDIYLPDDNQFENGDWKHVKSPHKTTIVKGGAQGKNPFRQVMDQRDKFNSLVEEFARKDLLPSENIEPDDTFAIVCFQQKVNLLNEVPSRVKRLFNVADPTSIVDVVEAAVFVDPNEWKGRINGYKLSGNVFALVKKIFRADKYDPFEDNSLFAEFESIDCQDESSVEEQIESGFLEHVAIIDEFLNGDSHVLKIEADSASNRIGFTQRVVSEYLRRKGIDDSDPGIESGVCYLAPSNKYVNQIINQNGPASIRSLYGKLYDYDNTDIELLSNNINEREIFPLVENKDSDGMLYVIFHAHLVYDFAPNPEDLIR